MDCSYLVQVAIKYLMLTATINASSIRVFTAAEYVIITN